LLLDGIGSYNFITQDLHDLPGVYDDEEFEATNAAFKLYGLSEEDIGNVWKIMAGILAFGQLEFAEGRRTTEQASLKNDPMAQKVAQLFGIDRHSDLVKSLTNPLIRAGTERVKKAQNKEQCDSAVKALAKATYERLFLWVVQRINLSLDKTRGRGSKQFIGILDIAGFEIFENNSFEQLLINFTNEKLQQLFNHRMFIMEQNEYKSEGIEWDFIDFGLDLQPTIDLIEAQQPTPGMLPMLDEQSIFPKATDETFVHKCTDTFGRGKSKSYSERKPREEGDFAIKHYAGEVVYDATGFLHKNKDPVNDNVVNLFKESSNPFMKTIWSTTSGQGKVSNRQRGALRTVAGIYTSQLKNLMAALKATTPRFVRCIKPNDEKRPGLINAKLVLKQLQCGGVLEGIRIVRKGFPNRVMFEDFRQRYQILTPDILPEGFVDSARAAELMLGAIELDAKHDYRIGHTKIFFRAGILAKLEEQRDQKLSAMLVGLQTYCRGYLARLAFKYHVGDSQAVDIIQRNVRIFMKLRNWPWWRLYCRIKPMLKELAKQQNHKDLEAEIAKLKAQLEEMNAKLEAEADGKKELQALIAQLEEELRDAQDEVAFQQAQLQTEKVRNADFEEELEAADLKIEEIFAEKSKLIEDKADLVEKIENLEDDLATGQADQAMRERLEKEKGELQEKMEEVEMSLAQQAKKLKALEAEKVTALERADELESQVSKADKKASQARNEADDLSTQVSDLSSQLAAATRKAKQHGAEVKQEQERVTSLDAELAAATGKLHKAETQVLNLEGELEEANDKKESQQRTITQLKRDLEDLSATDDLEIKVKTLQAELRTKDDTLADAEEELEELTTDMGTLKRERDEARQALHKLRLEQEAEDTKSAPLIKRLQEQNAELQDDCDAYAARNSRLNAEKSDFESRAADAESQLEDSETATKRKDKKIKSLEKRLALLVAQGGEGGASADEQARWEEQKKKLKQERDDAEDKVEAVTLGKRRVQRELDEIQELMDAKEKDNKRLRDQLAKMRRDISAMHDDDADSDAEA